MGSETGEMCAMKEVMLFSDDAKSKKFAKKLEQEIAVLSSLSHPNIVQYYGSETVDKKLYITSQFDLLSFEGSPYWLAPEVVMNPNGCSLAVDIWSLGCTVLEMATSKPPWSQYDKLSSRLVIVKNFQQSQITSRRKRNPLYRPTAAKLLEHPFVKYNIHASDMYSPRNIGHEVSPVVFPALNEKISPSPVSSSQTRSRTSTAQTGVILHHRLNQSIISPGSSYKMPKLLPSPCSNSPTYWDPDILRGLHSGYRAAIHEHTSSDNERQKTLPYDRNYSVLADRVSLGQNRFSAFLFCFQDWLRV
ncbi:hypothetical protein ACJIZ3_009135 [Penstemon smallii]|uniref:Protein kinase domain-containing protein n=1 Tax=Penstemon smallii TaxID=265156 RepID=A0ABD3TBN0_9LAMI